MVTPTQSPPGQVKAAKVILQVLGWICTVAACVFLIAGIAGSSNAGATGFSFVAGFIYFALLFAFGMLHINAGRAIGEGKSWGRITGFVLAGLMCAQALISWLTPDWSSSLASVPGLALVLALANVIVLGLGLTVIICLAVREASAWFAAPGYVAAGQAAAPRRAVPVPGAEHQAGLVKRCPDCAIELPMEAKLCHRCRHTFTQEEQVAALGVILRSPDASQRLQAAVALKETGTASALPLLSEALGDTDERVEEAALQAVVALVRLSGEDVAAALKPGLASEKVSLRLHALDALAAEVGIAALPQLHAALKDYDIRVVLKAIGHVRTIGSAGSFPVLTDLYLHPAIERRPPQTGEYFRFDEQKVRGKALEALLGIAGPSAAQILEGQLARVEHRDRPRLLKVIIRLGAPAIPTLFRLLEDDQLGAEARSALIYLGQPVSGQRETHHPSPTRQRAAKRKKKQKHTALLVTGIAAIIAIATIGFVFWLGQQRSQGNSNPAMSALLEYCEEHGYSLVCSPIYSGDSSYAAACARRADGTWRLLTLGYPRIGTWMRVASDEACYATLYEAVEYFCRSKGIPVPRRVHSPERRFRTRVALVERYTVDFPDGSRGYADVLHSGCESGCWVVQSLSQPEVRPHRRGVPPGSAKELQRRRGR